MSLPSVTGVRASEHGSPERVGRYELLRELASGGMAAVHLARLVGGSGVERLVAVKRIHPHLGKDRTFTEMFLDEARIASRIHHPNVCQIVEYGSDDGAPFLAMELLVGEPLHRILDALADREGRPDDAAVLATVVAEACDGLHAAHELRNERGEPMQVVHRDVSPQNLFVTFEGAVKVVDFGIASAADKVHHTETGTVKGRFAYMAPEQVSGARVDRRADVWSLGVVLWEVLARRRLFRRASPSETIRAVDDDPIALPSQERSDVPPSLDAVVLRALSRDREARHPTARALGEDIRAALATSPRARDRAAIASWMHELFPDRPPLQVPSTVSEPRERSGEADRNERSTRVARPSSRPRRRPIAAAGAAVALAVLAALGAAVLATTPQQRDGARPAEARPLADGAAAMPAAPEVEPSPVARAIEPVAVVPLPSEPVVPPVRVSRRRPIRAPGAPAPAAPIEPQPIARETDATPSCLTVGGGARVLLSDGRLVEGPRRVPCIRLAPGPHRLRVESPSSGELLWESSVDVRPGDTRAITAQGMR